MGVLEWLLDADPSVRWQALQDLADAPPEVVTPERARVATEGWGARLLALQGPDGQWDGGAYFPARSGDDENAADDGSQLWTATAYSLLLLRDLGADPNDERMRRAVALVAERC